MRIEAKVTVAAPREEVWKRVADPPTYPTFFKGVTKWEHAGGKRTGCGARYSVRMHVGNAYVGGTIEIVEYHRGVELAWVGITGISQRGRWRLREGGDGSTELTLRLIYDSPGGLWGQLAELVAAPMVSANLSQSLRELKRQVEADSPTWPADQPAASKSG